MMSKQEKILWTLFAGILVLLFLLSSTDLIFKEKKTEIYPISVIIGDTTDDYYVNFRKGVDQAADEYHADVNFITLYEKHDAAGQMELLKREIDDWAGAVVLAPVEPVECAKILDGMVVNSPVIIAGGMFPSENVKSGISVNYQEAGRKLGEAIAAENTGDLSVYIFMEDKRYGYNQEAYDGLTAVLEEKGFRTIVCEKESGDAFRLAIEETVYPGSGPALIAALDLPGLEAAADIISGNPVYGEYIKGIYGIGSTTKLLHQMDRGVIKGLVTYNRFDEGYLSVEKAVEAIKKGGQREQVLLDSYYIEKKDLRESRYEKMLYPID